MNRHLFLAISFTSLLIFSTSQALTLEFSTCNFFNYGCDRTSQNSVQKNTGSFSFANFFNKWELPKWEVPSFFGNAQNTENPAQVAQLGGTFSPSTINIDNKTSDPNAPKSSDFGILNTLNSRDESKNSLLNIQTISERKAIFDCALKPTLDCNKNILPKSNDDKLQDPKNENPISPGSEYGGAVYSDRLTGTASPNYDSGEENHINSGPLQRGVDDSVIRNSAQNFNGSQYFVNRGTGSCANFGIDVGGSCPDVESYKSDFKATVSNLCSNLTGKRLKITSGNRSASCNARVGGASGSSHMSGLAMDTRLDNYSGDEKVIVVLYLAAQGFNNFGGYGPNSAMHFDMRSDVNRWGPNYSISSCESRLFPDYFRKAMVLMGSDPCQRDYNLRQKAIATLNKMGKLAFTKPANNKATQQ